MCPQLLSSFMMTIHELAYLFQAFVQAESVFTYQYLFHFKLQCITVKQGLFPPQRAISYFESTTRQLPRMATADVARDARLSGIVFYQNN